MPQNRQTADDLRFPLANMLTLTRVLLAPIVAGSFFLDRVGVPLFAARLVTVGLVMLCELSDAFDGFAARRFNQVSDIGKILDPFADSFYRFTIFASFMAVGYMPLGMLLIFFYRDSIVSMLRIVSGLGGIAMSARISGKLKAVVQATGMFAVFAVDLVRYNPFMPSLAEALPWNAIIFWIFAAVAAYTLYSAIDYTLGSIDVLKKV
jgi:cardiolipin synthase